MDIIAFANLAQILYIENSTSFPLRDFMTENCSNLVGLCSRMKERCFPDWEKICDTLDMNTHLPKPQKEEEKESKGEKEAKESKEGKEGDKEKADAEEKEGEKDKEVEENKEKEERVEDK
uniref:Metaxin glutathione S-transferase domain-containing protein n=1 Tax=Bracon brevicornis TaxID=1563983 RepID=A0A6V7LH56_9HYME